MRKQRVNETLSLRKKSSDNIVISFRDFVSVFRPCNYKTNILSHLMFSQLKKYQKNLLTFELEIFSRLIVSI